MDHTFVHSAPFSLATTALGSLVTYEQRLFQNLNWALGEGSLFFENRGCVHESLRRITDRLKELQISYAVCGGIAQFIHGYRRFTENIDILISRECLQLARQQLIGKGYLSPSESSRQFRDVLTGVRITFFVTGRFPGDGQPKAYTFPDPVAVAQWSNGIQIVNLPTLFDMKLAAVMSGDRPNKHVGDIQEFLKLATLKLSFAESLHPYVREKYREMWHQIHDGETAFYTMWLKTAETGSAQTIDELIARLPSDATRLIAMRDDGVVFDKEMSAARDCFVLATTDRFVAKRYDMAEEHEFW